MIWLILIALIDVSYYILKANHTSWRERIFSFLSMYLAALTLAVQWNESLLLFIGRISLYLPFIFGIAGVILGWLGLKGDVRISLSLINVLALGYYLVLFFVATVGFQEP